MCIPLHLVCVYLKSEANSSVVRVVVVCSCMFVVLERCVRVRIETKTGITKHGVSLDSALKTEL